MVTNVKTVLIVLAMCAGLLVSEVIAQYTVVGDPQNVFFVETPLDFARLSPGKTDVVIFWATWCHYCGPYKETLKGIAPNYPHVKFVFAESDKFKDIVRRNNIRVLPTTYAGWDKWKEGVPERGELIKLLERLESDAKNAKSVSQAAGRGSYIGPIQTPSKEAVASNEEAKSEGEDNHRKFSPWPQQAVPMW